MSRDSGSGEVDREAIENAASIFMTAADGVIINAEVEWFKGGDYLVTLFSGTDEQGAPIAIHAIYDDVEKVFEFYSTLEGLEAAELHEALAELRNEYELRVAAGLGSWIVGDAHMERQRAAVKS